MSSSTIVVATQQDYGEIISCLASSLETLDEYASLDEYRRHLLVDHLEELIEEHQVYVLKQGRNVLGFAVIGHSLEDEFFPQTHSYSKSEDLLEEIGYRGEPLLILRYFFVGGFYQNRGHGGELIKSLFARYKDATWFLYIEEGNRRATKFFQSHGFFPCGDPKKLEHEDAPKLILAKKYRPSGLCRESIF